MASSLSTIFLVSLSLVYIVWSEGKKQKCPDDISMLFDLKPPQESFRIKTAQCFCFYRKTKIDENSKKEAIMNQTQSCLVENLKKGNGTEIIDNEELFNLILEAEKKDIQVLKKMACCCSNVLVKAGITGETQFGVILECYSMNQDVETCVEHEKN